LITSYIYIVDKTLCSCCSCSMFQCCDPRASGIVEQ